MINELHETYRKFGRVSEANRRWLKELADCDRSCFLQEVSSASQNPRYQSNSPKYRFGDISYHTGRLKGDCVLLYSYYTQLNNGYRNYNRRVLVLTGPAYGRVVSYGMQSMHMIGSVREEVPRELRND